MENNSKVFTFSQEGYKVPQPVEKLSTGSNKYVAYGENNQYPAFIWDLYEGTSHFQTLVNNLVDYIMGDDITFEGVSFDNMDEVLRKCALDLVLLNYCLVQRVYSKTHQLVGVYYLDAVKTRFSEDGKKVFYSDNWGNYSKKWIEIPIDDPTADTDCIIYKATCKSIYPTPLYSGAIKSIVTLNKVDTYHLNNISNGFSENTMISFCNGTPDEETKSKIEKQIKDKFAGENNAGKFMVSWNDSKDNAPEITKFPADNNVKKFDTLYATCKENLSVAFRCPSQLIGLSSQSTGFSNIEYEQAFKLFNKTVVMPLQKKLLAFYDKVLEGKGRAVIAAFTLPDFGDNNE